VIHTEVMVMQRSPMDGPHQILIKLSCFSQLCFLPYFPLVVK